MAAREVTRRTLAASVTPLRSGGDEIDVDVIPALVDFYAESGLDGLLVLGTTGEGVMLDVDERRRVAEGFCSAANGRIDIVVHCGAQSTRDTAVLAAHAAHCGAGGVAVIAPPYYAFQPDAVLEHFALAAAACDGVPFYVYEFAARSGYAVPVQVIHDLHARCANVVGLKVSDAPFELVTPYLIDGLDVYIGAEGLIHQGLQAGARGAVSGLAAALPEITLAAVRTPSEATSRRAGEVRQSIQRHPFQAALKHVLRRRGVPLNEDVRAPLSRLDGAAAQSLDHLLDDLHIAPGESLEA